MIRAIKQPEDNGRDELFSDIYISGNGGVSPLVKRIRRDNGSYDGPHGLIEVNLETGPEGRIVGSSE
ncbi:hypothetical protein CMI47_22300 [Candidatus Pacearchaeota archaeon]|nr:hypothetical protein [Candidatus Pacearchaeota archaeon]|tara:strand:- start:9032 stop:9232 length:201 start_codon:yes stop_codon:yes gene_type:complete